MKKKKIFYSGNLQIGGISKILLEILKSINKEKYEIILLINEDYGKKNYLEEEVPEGIPIKYIKSEWLLKKGKI